MARCEAGSGPDNPVRHPRCNLLSWVDAGRLHKAGEGCEAA